MTSNHKALSTDVDQLCRALLYEGYLLYPYRPSVKSHCRWNFGCVYPRDCNFQEAGREGWKLRVQCLVQGPAAAQLTIKLRFLHQESIEEMIHPETAREEAVEQSFEDCSALSTLNQERMRPFHFPGMVNANISQSNAPGQNLFRRRETILGELVSSAEQLRRDLWKLTIECRNVTPCSGAGRDAALPNTLLSTHLLLSLENGAFISAIDPPEHFTALASECRCRGLWPVLVGPEGAADKLLCAPIILYDHPEIAPESPGDLFDNAEIDEILSLRVMTLSDEEKRAVQSGDPRGRDLLARTERLARAQLSGLHGTFRPGANPETAVPNGANSGLNRVAVGNIQIQRGDKVKLKPRRQADAFDMMLNGETATVESIMQDMENRIHLGVTIDADPGRDLGRDQKIGHRFFFGLEEIEPLGANERI